MKKNIYLLALYLFSYSVNSSEIKVPTFLVGVKKHEKALQGEYHHYKLDYKLGPLSIKPKQTKNLSIEELVQSLVNSYEIKSQQDFLKLFSSKARAGIQAMTKEQFQQVWGFYTSQKNWVLQFYHAHKNGYLIGLKSEGQKNLNLQFAVKAGGIWYFDSLEFNSDDPESHNIGMWMTYQAMKIQPAQLIQSFKNLDSKKFIEAQILHQYLAVLVKTKDRWELLGQVKDNEDEFSTWADKNKALGIVRIDLEDYQQNEESEVLLLDSSFPIEFYPLNLQQNGQFTP